MKRLFLAVILAALVASIVSPMAVSASAPKGSRVTSFWCAVSFSGWGKADAMEFVRDVRAESQVLAPEDASDAVVNYIQGRYAQGCGSELDTYVRVRVSANAYSWYRQVVDLNT
jgi:hypothetical protein